MSSAEWSNVCLIINALLWITIFALYQYKTRYFGVGSGILLLYTGISIAAIHLYNSDYSYLYDEIHFYSLIYLLLMILIAIYPILSLKESKIIHIHPPSKLLFNVTCICIIMFALMGLPRVINLLKENMIILLLDNDGGMELYGDQVNDYTSKSTSQMDLMSIMSNICGSISVVFLMYYLTIKKRNKIILIGLILTSLIAPLGGIVSGGRATLAMYMFNIFFMLIFVRNIFSKTFKKKIFRFFLGALILLLIPFVSVTISRSSGDLERALLSIERYAAEGPIRFSNYGLNAGGTREGDYTAVAFKKILCMNPAMYYSGRLNKYSHMKLNESVFYTFVGDFTLDYGPFWTVLIFITTSIFFKKCLKVKNNSITFHQLLMFYLLMVGCLGYFQWPLGRESGNLQLIALLFLSIVFKLDYDYKSRI